MKQAAQDVGPDRASRSLFYRCRRTYVHPAKIVSAAGCWWVYRSIYGDLRLYGDLGTPIAIGVGPMFRNQGVRSYAPSFCLLVLQLKRSPSILGLPFLGFIARNGAAFSVALGGNSVWANALFLQVLADCSGALFTE